MFFVVSILFICILSLSSVSAQDNQTNDVLGDNSNYKTFNDLQEDIDSSTGTLTLDSNYKFNTSDSKAGISITKPIVINGNGYVIDAANSARIFSVLAESVTLKNITFKNAGGQLFGGAVHWSESNGNLTDCQFISCSADISGGAVYWSGSNGVIDNCLFESCVAGKPNVGGASGGAVCAGGGIQITNSIFDSNSAHNGGGLDVYGTYANMDNLTFINNSATTNGGGALVRSSNTNLKNSRFINNSAIGRGGGLNVEASGGEYDYLEFINNSAALGGGLFIDGKNTYAILSSSSFYNNFASYGGGAILEQGIGEMVNLTIVNNSAYNYGGGISLNNAWVFDSTLINNSAYVGGGIYAKGGNLNNVTFKDNHANLFNSIALLNDIQITDCDYNDADKGKLNVTDNINVTKEGSYRFIELTNGFYGYCMEKYGNSATNEYFYLDLDLVKNRLNGEMVGEYLKIFIYDNINSMDFIQAGFSLYNLADEIYEFTDGNYLNSKNKNVQKAVKLYNEGLRIPNNATKILNNGTVLTFEFASYITSAGNQNFFCFRVIPRNPVNETLTKDTLNETVPVGEEVEFNITIHNQYNFTMVGIVVEDNDYSKDLTYVGWRDTGDGWTYNETTKRWSLDSLESGESASFIVKFLATASGTLYNNVTSWSRNTTVIYSKNTTRAFIKNLTIEKIALNKTVLLGEQTTFKIIAKNTGEINLNNVTITEVSYDGLIYDSYDSSDSWQYFNNHWVLNKVLKPGEEVSLYVTFNTTRAGNFTNIACVNSSETKNKTTNNTTTVLKPDLLVEKITLTPQVTVGSLVSFDIVVKNIGDVDLSDVRIVETNYPGLIYYSWDEDTLWTFEEINGNPTWSLNTNLTVGEILAIKVYFNTTREGNFTNTVIVTSNETENKTTKNTTEVLKPDLTVEKIALNKIVNLGSVSVFEILVKNTGEVDLGDVTLKEVIPEGLSYVGYHETQLWNYSGDFVWKFNGVLKVNEYASLFVYFNTTKLGNLTNVVTVSSNETENKTTNNTTEVLKPDLTVEKIALNKSVPVNSQVTFEIMVKNTGETDLNDVTITDIAQDGLKYIGYHETSLWNYTNGVWKFNGVLTKGSSSILFVYFNTTQSGNFTNTAVVSSNETENKTDNDTVEVLNPLLNVEKIALEKTVSLGSLVTFEIIVHNIGQVDLNNVAVRDIAPNGLTYVSYKDSGLWTYSNGVWTLNDVLKVGEYATFYVIFNTTKTGNFTNAVVANSNETSNITNNTTISVLSGDLRVEKISLTPEVVVGNQTIFEIVVKNIGKIDLHDVYIIEESYDGLIYDSFKDNSEWSYSNGKWVLKHVLKPNEYSGIIVVFNTTKIGNFTNYVSAGSSESNETYSNNTTAVFNKTEDLPVHNGTEIESFDLIKTAINPIVSLGNQAIFQIIIHNTGNTILHNVTITEEFYDGLIYDSFVDYMGFFRKNDDLSWTIETFYPGEYSGFTIYFNTTTAGNFTNIVSAWNKTATDTVEVLKPSYTIEKIALYKTLRVGDLAIFEIVVHNDGNMALDNITINELSYEGLKYLYFIDYSDLWIFNDDLSWTLNANLHPGEYSGFFVVFNTTLVGEFVNFISSGDLITSDTVNVINESWDFDKIAITKLVKVGDQAIFEIIVHNDGELPLENIVVREIQFDGLIYDHYIDNTGMWSYNNLTWILTSKLVPGEYSGFFVVFNTTDVGEFTNVVTINNETRNDTVEVCDVDYEIKKIALNKNVALGDEVTFQIVIHNIGKVNLYDVVVKESSFEGMEFVSYLDPDAFWSYDNLTWTLNEYIAPNAYLEFFVIFKTTKPGELVNVITSGNKTANDTVFVNVAEYTIEKIALNKSVNIGEEAVFEIVLHNIGNIALNNVTIAESLFDGLEYIGYFDATTKWINNGLIWTLNDALAPGEYIGFFVIFKTAKPGELVNVITSGNKTANDTVFVNVAEYTIEKIALNKSVNIGEEAVFEIVLHNIGNIALNNVTIAESLFDGLEYIGYFDAANKWINNGLIWTLNDALAPGEYIGFFVIFNTTSVGNLTNTIVSGNITANATLEVLNKTSPDENKTIPENKTLPEDNVVINREDKTLPATGNPMLLILIVLLNLVILNRRRK